MADPAPAHTQLRGDPAAALEWLRWLRPAGPWLLTAIPPEGGVTNTATFGPDDAEALAAWVTARDGRMNLYFMVNLQRGRLDKKAKKEDVEAVEFLHVDADPDKDADLGAERVRILAELQAFRPAASAIIDSGGGYQAFWRLEEPFQTQGNEALAAEVEAYNIQFSVLFRGDNCHNVDRIMRLPGTVNVPDARKLKKGRVARVATLVSATGATYPLAAFTPAPRVQGTGGGGAKVELSGNLPRVGNLDEDLPPHVSLRTKMLIVQGDDPDDPTRYGSRSEIVFAVCCELIRAGCSNDLVAAVLLDPDFGISAHVRDQRRPAQYAARQIQRAREEVEDPLLRQFNEDHAVIEDLGGKCRVISEVMDTSLDKPRMRLSKQSFEDFRNRYMNRKVQVGAGAKGQPIYAPAGKWWLEHPMRRQYKALVFAPKRDVPDAYNLWQGFACEAIPGENHLPFLDHVRENICSGDADHYAYLLGWLARAAQQPGSTGEVAVVLRGGQGTGKGTFVTLFGSLWGRHYLHVSNAKHLIGQFNAHLRDCVVLHGDEAFFAGDKQHESVLKTLITEDTLIVEGKGVDAEVGPNYVHMMMSSNAQWVVPAGMDDRRFFVLDVGDGQKRNSAYFAALRRAMMAGGRENLLHYLLSYDISNYDVRRPPQTQALRDQKLFSMAPEEQWWFERLQDGRVTAGSPEWSTEVLKERFQTDYLRYCEAQRIPRRMSPTALGRFLARSLPGDYPVSTQRMTDVERVDDRDGSRYTVRERAYWYTIPHLEECRAFWDKLYGGPFPWPADATNLDAARGAGEPY